MNPFQSFNKENLYQIKEDNLYNVINAPMINYDQSSINKYHFELKNESEKNTRFDTVNRKEELYSNKMDEFLKKKGISDWPKVFLISSFLLVLVSLLINFLRAHFLDVNI